MRHLAALFFLLAAAIGMSQQPSPDGPQSGSEPPKPTAQELMGAMTAPQISLTIRKQPGNADYVIITVVKPDYPEELLREQIAELGRLTNSEPRGVQVGKIMIDEKKNLSFLRSAFVVEGLIEPTTRRFELNTIIKAFLGAPAPNTIDSLHIIFEGETPVPNRTLDKFSDDKVSLVGNFYQSPRSVEYRVMTKTQNPDDIKIPLDAPNQAVKPASPVGPARATPLIIGLILIAGIALGALVYFAMLRSPKA